MRSVLPSAHCDGAVASAAGLDTDDYDDEYDDDDDEDGSSGFFARNSVVLITTGAVITTYVRACRNLRTTQARPFESRTLAEHSLGTRAASP